MIGVLFLALLDIPVYESRVQSLHALFTLYLGFKNSEVKKKTSILILISISLHIFQHFKAMMNVSEPVTRRGGDNTGADQMIID